MLRRVLLLAQNRSELRTYSAAVLTLYVLCTGIGDVELLGIERFWEATEAPQVQPWVPWHLDRIHQSSRPLDGRYTASATGKGVAIWIVGPVSTPCRVSSSSCKHVCPLC